MGTGERSAPFLCDVANDLDRNEALRFQIGQALPRVVTSLCGSATGELNQCFDGTTLSMSLISGMQW